jgi:hypothetical protein
VCQVVAAKDTGDDRIEVDVLNPTSTYSTLPIPYSRTMRSLSIALLASAIALRAQAFDCALTAAGIEYDLKPLGGLRTATHTSSTPPTSNEAKVLMNLCGGIGSEDGASDEDKVCLLLAHVQGGTRT